MSTDSEIGRSSITCASSSDPLPQFSFLIPRVRTEPYSLVNSHSICKIHLALSSTPFIALHCSLWMWKLYRFIERQHCVVAPYAKVFLASNFFLPIAVAVGSSNKPSSLVNSHAMRFRANLGT